MKKILMLVLMLGLFNGCLFHHPRHGGYYSDGYDNHSYRDRDHYYDDRERYRHNNYERRDNHRYRNHGDTRMHVPMHGR